MALWWLDMKIKRQIMGCISSAGNAYFNFGEITCFALQKWSKFEVRSIFGL